MGAAPVICILGPTGTGKTALALAAAACFDVELISVDSAMVYRRMDIGTAKPAPAEREAVRHHLVDIREPWEAYSAGEFRADALRLIDEIRARGRTPLLVGGTLLYFRALAQGLAELPPADPALRAQLDAEAARSGWPALHARLAGVDPVAAARIQPADRQRIQRALEVFMLTGEPLSALQAAGGTPLPGLRRLALVPGDRERLYAGLDARLEEMLAAGFIDEVRALMAEPRMSVACPAMRAVGYRQLWRHLAGELGLDEALRQARVATRRLAKRQLTWLRSERPDLVLDPQAPDCRARALAALADWGVALHGGMQYDRFR